MFCFRNVSPVIKLLRAVSFKLRLIHAHRRSLWKDKTFIEKIKHARYRDRSIGLLCTRSKWKGGGGRDENRACENAKGRYLSHPASYPDVSLSMKMCAQRKAGRRQHGPLRFIASHSGFVLAFTMRKTKRLRRRLSLTSFPSVFPASFAGTPGSTIQAVKNASRPLFMYWLW